MSVMHINEIMIKLTVLIFILYLKLTTLLAPQDVSGAHKIDYLLPNNCLEITVPTGFVS